MWAPAYPIGDIQIMPSLFQGRIGVDPAIGVDQTHYLSKQGVAFDPKKQAPVLLWRAPDGGFDPRRPQLLGVVLGRVQGAARDAELEPNPGAVGLLAGHNRVSLATRSGVTEVAVEIRANMPLRDAHRLADDTNVDVQRHGLEGLLNSIKPARVQEPEHDRCWASAGASSRRRASASRT